MQLTLLVLFFLSISYIASALPILIDLNRPNSLEQLRKTDALLLNRWQADYPSRLESNPLTVPLPSLLDPLATYKSPETGYIEETYGLDQRKKQDNLANILGIASVLDGIPGRSDPKHDHPSGVKKPDLNILNKENKKIEYGPDKNAAFGGGVGDILQWMQESESNYYNGNTASGGDRANVLQWLESSGADVRYYPPSTTPPIWSTKGKADGLWPIPPPPPPPVCLDCGRDDRRWWERVVGWCKGAWTKVKGAFTPKPKRDDKPKTSVVSKGSPDYDIYAAKGRQDWLCCDNCWSSGNDCSGN